MEHTPPWLTVITILAPILASLGVLWLTNLHNARMMRAQHNLLLDKERLATIVGKAEQIYHDLENWKHFLFMDGEWSVDIFQTCQTEQEYYEHIAEKPSEVKDFDLVRLELFVRAYFPVLMRAYKLVLDMVDCAGRIRMEFAKQVGASPEDKDRIVREFRTARDEAFETLEMFSEGLAAHIAGLVGTAPDSDPGANVSSKE